MSVALKGVDKFWITRRNSRRSSVSLVVNHNPLQIYKINLLLQTKVGKKR